MTFIFGFIDDDVWEHGKNIICKAQNGEKLPNYQIIREFENFRPTFSDFILFL